MQIDKCVSSCEQFWINRVSYTSSMRSPFRMPACSAAPLSRTALTCCKGAYNSPFMLRNWPPSLTWPRTLNPKPVSVLFIVTTRGPFDGTFILFTLFWTDGVSAIILTDKRQPFRPTTNLEIRTTSSSYHDHCARSNLLRSFRTLFKLSTLIALD